MESKAYIDGNIGGIVNNGEKYMIGTFVFPNDRITMQSASDAFNSVIERAGAICPYRCPVNRRILQEIVQGTGKIINSQADTGGWPVLNSGTPLSDTDQDGMPDYWEKQYNLDTDNSYDCNGTGLSHDNGYTNIEVYINSLIDGNDFP